MGQKSRWKLINLLENIKYDFLLAWISKELLDFFEEFREIWLWFGLESLDFWSIRTGLLVVCVVVICAVTLTTGWMDADPKYQFIEWVIKDIINMTTTIYTTPNLEAEMGFWMRIKHSFLLVQVER